MVVDRKSSRCRNVHLKYMGAYFSLHQCFMQPGFAHASSVAVLYATRIGPCVVRITALCNQGRCCAALIFPDRRQDLPGLVVASQAVDTGLHQDETELGVTVLAAALKVLADGDGLLDEEVEVLWDVGRQTLGLEHTQDLVPSHKAHLRHSVRVTQDDTNL